MNAVDASCVMPATSSWPGSFGRIISTAKNRSRYRGRIWRGRSKVDKELRKLMSQELDEIFDKAHLDGEAPKKYIRKHFADPRGVKVIRDRIVKSSETIATASQRGGG